MGKMTRRAIMLFAVLVLLLPLSVHAADGSTIVYRTATGECYHRGTCSYLKSKIEISLAKAVEMGLRPCSRCSPPTLDAVTASTPAPVRQNPNYVLNPPTATQRPIPTVAPAAVQRTTPTTPPAATAAPVATQVVYVEKAPWYSWLIAPAAAIFGAAVATRRKKR